MTKILGIGNFKVIACPSSYTPEWSARNAYSYYRVKDERMAIYMFETAREVL